MPRLGAFPFIAAAAILLLVALFVEEPFKPGKRPECASPLPLAKRLGVPVCKVR